MALRSVSVGLLLASVGLSGCGAPAVLDGAAAEARIGERLEATYEVEVTRVSCPEDVEVAEGATFRCEAAVAEAGTVTVEVTQTDDEGGLEVASTRAVISTPRVEADVAETLADRFDRDEVEVTCDGPPVRLEEPEATFTCVAVDGPDETVIEVRVRDARGALAYTVLDGE